MSYTLHFEQPQFPPETVFGVGNLGLIKNGDSVEIDEDTERLFLAVHHISIEDAYSDKVGFSLTGSSSLSDQERSSLLPAKTETEAETETATATPVETETPAEQTVEGV